MFRTKTRLIIPKVCQLCDEIVHGQNDLNLWVTLTDMKKMLRRKHKPIVLSSILPSKLVAGELSRQPKQTTRIDLDNLEKENAIDKEIVCEICGDMGYKELLICCDRCNLANIHQYCMDIIPKKEDIIKWTCINCEPTTI